MIQQNIKLSALLTTHIPKADLFTILNSLLRMSAPDVEVVIIDDAASAEVTRELQQTVEAHNNDLVVLLEHETATGRGVSLNEALVQATGAFIWAPVRAERFNVNLFRQALHKFQSDPAAIWVMDYDLPSTVLSWLDEAEEGRLPDDSCYIWNRNVLSGEEFFFNPFLTHLNGAELAMRVQADHVWHRTDPFFVIENNQFLSPAGQNLEEFFRTAHRSAGGEKEKRRVLDRFSNTDFSPNTEADDADLLTQSRQLLAQDNVKHALELINAYLKNSPKHAEALQIKISALEKLRRHVEAAELKHDLRHINQGHDEHDPEESPIKPEPAAEPAKGRAGTGNSAGADGSGGIEFSIVVPTTGLGKFDLERCLASVEKAVPRDRTELIVVDNASIDDTFDYLEQLEEKDFLNVRTITHSVNRGFGASANRGIAEAKGRFILVMHTDVELTAGVLENLVDGFAHGDKIALTAPVVDATDYAAQTSGAEDSEEVVLTDKVDSCCFMVQHDFSFEFDEEFGLAFYEMDDICKQITESGYQIAVASRAEVSHGEGATTNKLGFRLKPQRKWKNRGLFHNKWEEPAEYTVPADGSIADRLEKLEPPVDPSEPPAEWVEAVNSFLTDEIRTEIVRSELNKRELLVIVSTLLMADSRELLRTLEDSLNNVDLPVSMLMLFVDYYFEKNIYSRCRHYLEKAGDSHPAFDLFRLKIYVADKEQKQASELLGKLLKTYPASPDLFSEAAKLYRQDGDEDEANSFAAMANQLDPVQYPPEETVFEVKF